MTEQPDALVKRADQARETDAPVYLVDLINSLSLALADARAINEELQASVAIAEDYAHLAEAERDAMIHPDHVDGLIKLAEPMLYEALAAETDRADRAEAERAAQIEEIGFARLLVDTGWSEHDGDNFTYHRSVTLKLLGILDKVSLRDRRCRLRQKILV